MAGDTRFADLRRRLGEQGWEIVSRDLDPEWWAAEIWMVESIWSPPGFTLFITWLRDPEAEKLVWAVGAGPERPTNRLEAADPVCASLRHWPRDIPEFLEALATLRDTALHTT